MGDDLARMKALILEYIGDDPSCSFAQLSRDIPGFRGDRALVAGPFENLILWNDISAEAADALAELEREGKIQYKTTQVLTYAIDGEVLTFKLARGFRSYAKPRWLPVVICQVPVKRRKPAL